MSAKESVRGLITGRSIIATRPKFIVSITVTIGGDLAFSALDVFLEASEVF
jgi:hypothetical protein